MNSETQTERLASWVKESGRIVFFGGAGISTESGFPISVRRRASTKRRRIRPIPRRRY